jgi:hypothetical protein
MKQTLFALALVCSFAFLSSSAFANPAMMKKHPGYPDETGKASTAVGEAASLKSAEDAPKVLKEQLKSDENERTGNVFSNDSRQNKHPGYPDRGVTENMIKEGSKVNANPK